MGPNKFLNFVISFFAGLIPEMVVAYIIMRLSNSGWSTFWIVYFSMQALYFIVWIFRSVVSWALFSLQGKMAMADGIYKILVKSKFPNPDQYYIEDGITYFGDIALNVNNEKFEEGVQLQAARIWAEMKAYDTVGQWRLLSQVKKSARMAIARYLNSNFPESK